jgi:hypothetical protein
MRPFLTVLATTSFLAFAGVGCAFESAQMKRAKDFIAVSEFESARTELRVQLHNEPDDKEAKALLLFMRLAEGGEDSASGCLISGNPGAAASTSAEEAQKEFRLKIRKQVLDAGIPTKDWDEYRAVLTRAVTYGWKEHDFPPDNIEPKLVFAFCAAAAGDATGTAYLVDHLANDDQRERAQSLLYLVGDSAIPSLAAVARSAENLARAHADTTLRNLRLAGLIEKLSSENPNRVSPTTVRTDSGRNQTGGKFMMNMGWSDANEGLKPVFAAAKVRAQLNQAVTTETSSPVIIRRATVGDTEVVLATVALPSSSNTEGGAPGMLQPAGINTTFLTNAWRWGGEDWAPLKIDGKPSVSGPDLAVLSLAGPPNEGMVNNLGPDQVAIKVYRGLQKRTERTDLGWYGIHERTVSGPRVDVFVYHLGPNALERVKTTNSDGFEIDAEGNLLPGQEEIYEGD